MANISETAAVILANAAARPDLKVFPLPKGMRVNGAAANKILDKLARTGLLESVAATRDDVVWNEVGEGQRKTLVVTDDGLRTIGVEAEAPTTTKRTTSKNNTWKKAPTLAHTGPTAAKLRKGGTKAPRKSSPARTASKASTKQDIVVGMLRRANGASIAELANATDWQPHSVRGVLTATIKGRLGLPLISEKGEDGVRRYYVAPISTTKAKTS
jgi:hypothetical protein